MGWLQWVIAVVLIISVATNIVVIGEYWQAKAERKRRAIIEADNLLYDAQTVRNARYVMSALEHYPECFPCREVIEKNLDKRNERYRLHP